MASNTWDGRDVASANVQLVAGSLVAKDQSGFALVQDANGTTPGLVYLVLAGDEDFGPKTTVSLAVQSRAGAAAGDADEATYRILPPNPPGLTVPSTKKVLAVQGVNRTAAGVGTQARVEFSVSVSRQVPPVGPSSSLHTTARELQGSRAVETAVGAPCHPPSARRPRFLLRRAVANADEC